ncbi:CPBP family intramembrane glutamic endopeptidase [Flavobacterium sp. ZS1P14]|uniref:CPBP family intramembrane glutamic endopeptidase n=1 Tax=Flavobacterium sp. ZS1P14 TaxID=3401729 RepID=UPI003AAAE22E
MLTTNNMIYLFSYVLFFVLSWISKTYNSNRLINDNGTFTSRPGKLIGFHIMGIIVLGLAPGILVKHSILKVLTGNKTPDLLLVFPYILIFMAIVIIAFRQSKSTYENKQESSGNPGHLSPDFFVSYFIIRSLFLFAYELWFRGFLLFDCISRVGTPLAFLVNTFLYVSVHIFNSKKEMWACIPFGILVCFLSILFDAAWPAIILHIGFSLVYELSLCRFNLTNFKIAKS